MAGAEKFAHRTFRGGHFWDLSVPAASAFLRRTPALSYVASSDVLESTIKTNDTCAWTPNSVSRISLLVFLGAGIFV